VDASMDAKAQLEMANARIIGVVLNHVKMDADDNSYYYYYRREEHQKDGAEEKDS
jgi:Mrp family chromosome partitioning ATPase